MDSAVSGGPLMKEGPKGENRKSHRIKEKSDEDETRAIKKQTAAREKPNVWGCFRRGWRQMLKHLSPSADEITQSDYV